MLGAIVRAGAGLFRKVAPTLIHAGAQKLMKSNFGKQYISPALAKVGQIASFLADA